MIATGPGISASLAEAARMSLDEAVSHLRDAGKLDAGKKTSERMGWTKETHNAAQELEKVCMALGISLSTLTTTEHRSLIAKRSWNYIECETSHQMDWAHNLLRRAADSTEI